MESESGEIQRAQESLVPKQKLRSHLALFLNAKIFSSVSVFSIKLRIQLITNFNFLLLKMTLSIIFLELR